MKIETNVILGRRQLPSLKIPGELFACYQPLLGGLAILVWLNLRWLVEVGSTGNTEQILQQQLDIAPEQLDALLQQLCQAGLLEITDTGQYVVNEPLHIPVQAANISAVAPSKVVPSKVVASKEAASEIVAIDEVAVASEINTVQIQASTEEKIAVDAQETSTGVKSSSAPPMNARDALARSKDNSTASATSAAPSLPTQTTVPPSSTEKRAVIARRPTRRRGDNKDRNQEGSDQLSADMQAVMQIFEKKMGVVGPSHFQKLRYWVEEMGMEGEVVAAAIEEAARNSSTRRISYIEGILRNWHNEGILTLRDIVEGNASRVLANQGQAAAPSSMEGTANAEAYKRVDPDMVRKWKELYRDEYNS